MPRQPLSLRSFCCGMLLASGFGKITWRYSYVESLYFSEYSMRAIRSAGVWVEEGGVRRGRR